MWLQTAWHMLDMSDMYNKPSRITSINSLFEQLVLNPYFVAQLFSLTLSFCENNNHYFINFTKTSTNNFT